MNEMISALHYNHDNSNFETVSKYLSDVINNLDDATLWKYSNGEENSNELKSLVEMAIHLTLYESNKNITQLEEDWADKILNHWEERIKAYNETEYSRHYHDKVKYTRTPEDRDRLISYFDNLIKASRLQKIYFLKNNGPDGKYPSRP